MRRLRLAVRCKLLVALAASGAVGVLVAGALASPNRPAAGAGVTFQLVAAPACTGGAKRLGRACVNRSEIPTWTTIADGSAKNDVPGQWLTSYSWTLPQTVPTAGAVLTLKADGEEKTGQPNARICPAISAKSGFTFKGETQPAGVGVCAEAVTKPKAGGTKTLRLLPANVAPGSTVTLTIYVQYALEYTYTYRAVATKKESTPKCRRPQARSQIPSAPAGVGGKPKCEYTVSYQFSARDKLESKEESRLPRPPRKARGHGTLTGTSLKGLLPVKKTGGNIISFNSPKGGNARIPFFGKGELRVVGGEWAHSETGTYLGLKTRVVSSTSAECPKGREVIVLLVQAIAESAALGDDVTVEGCKGFFPGGVGAQYQVDIEITPRTS
jgi:hypothetical protein